MSNIAIGKAPTDATQQSRMGPPATKTLIEGPILRTLLSLAWPHALALSSATCLVVAETSYVGQLGPSSLAAMALVFPFVQLTMSMSGAAMGGGIASSIARALGSGDAKRACGLAVHGLLLGAFFGVVFTLVMASFGPMLLMSLGGRGDVLSNAANYVSVFFGFAVMPWLMNSMTGILRGTGNTRLPSLMLISSTIIQIVLGGVLGLGLGPIPRLGMSGVAAGSIIGYTFSASVMAWHLFSGRARVVPRLNGLPINLTMFSDILKVGAASCLSPLQSVLTFCIFNSMLARFGTDVLAAYGIGLRLEFMLTSFAFAIGASSVSMIGMSIGAGKVTRARHVALVSGCLCFVIVGIAGSFLAYFSEYVLVVFSEDQGVRSAGRQYLTIAAPAYAFVALWLSTSFSSQGATRVWGPVLSQTIRLAFVAIGGWLLLSLDTTSVHFFWLATAAMVVLGTLSALSVLLPKWTPVTKAGQ